MFRWDKSIGGPVEFRAFLSCRLKPEILAIGYRKTLSAKTVTGRLASLSPVRRWTDTDRRAWRVELARVCFCLRTGLRFLSCEFLIGKS